MMNAAVVQDEDTVRTWIRVHYFEEACEPRKEFVAVVAPNCYMAINNALSRNGWENGISAIAFIYNST